VEARELDLITVVGKTEPVRIYELLGRAGELPPDVAELAREFQNGLKAYRARGIHPVKAALRRRSKGVFVTA